MQKLGKQEKQCTCHLEVPKAVCNSVQSSPEASGDSISRLSLTHALYADSILETRTRKKDVYNTNANCTTKTI